MSLGHSSVVRCWFAAFVCTFIACAVGRSEAKEIAITFDYLPGAPSFRQVDRQWVSDQILVELKKHEIKATGFVVAQSMEGGHDILGSWLNAGHTLGNLTWSHEDIDDLGATGFISGASKGHAVLEPMLSGFGQKKRYFRYPFSKYGSKPAVKQKVRDYLTSTGSVIAHATIVPEDYLHNLTMEQMPQPPDSASFMELQARYVGHILEKTVEAENLSKELLGRECRQILQLRVNLLNGWCIGEILESLREIGYEFVTLDRALADPIFGEKEKYLGSRGVGYLAMVAAGKRRISAGD